MRRLSYSNIMSTVAVFLALGGGAWAVTKPASGTVNACYDKRGALRVLVKATRCPKGFKKLTWSQAGPAGAPGARGPAGDPGPAGSTVQGSQRDGVADDDPRLADARVPAGAAGGDLAGRYPAPELRAGAVTLPTVAAALKDGPAQRPTLRSIGGDPGQVVGGDDPRLTDARPPTPNSVNAAAVVDGSLRIKDYAQGTGTSTINLPLLAAGSCMPVQVSAAVLAGDRVLISPGGFAPGLLFQVNAITADAPSITVQACNVTSAAIAASMGSLNYVHLR